MSRLPFASTARRRVSAAIAMRNSPINNPERLAALKHTGLLDSPAGHAFDRLTRLASLLLRAPAAMVSLVDGERQFFKSQLGLPEPWAARREAPLSHSFCRRVVENGTPVIIDDATTYEIARDNPDIDELRIAAYAGIPLKTAEGHVLGSFCVIDRQPRVWKPGEIGVLSELAASVMTEIALHTKTNELDAVERGLIRGQKLETLGTLAGGMAHEFGNILGAILGNAELARQEVGADHPVAEPLGEILAASRRARDLIRQVLGLARNQPAERSVLALRPIVEESARLLRAMLPRSVNLVAISNGAVPNVLGDATQIEQAILNLVTNAWHSLLGEPGTITISLDAVTDAPGAPAGPCARIVVRDTGAGMDAATIERIFEPFFTTKSTGEGTGLGLSIVHRIMQTHAGTVHASSQPGEGTAFTLHFPATPGEQSAHSPEPAVSPRGCGQRVWLLDDDEALVFLNMRALKRIGYEVSAFTDPDKALRAFRENPDGFALAIIDAVMPRIPGIEVVAQLRALRPALPIILATGLVTDGLRQTAEEAGIRHILQKPNTISELEAAIHAALNERAED